jgi:hypothetical protein
MGDSSGDTGMGYFILETSLFVIGAIVFVIGKLPLTRRRIVSGSPTRVIGFILMIPLGIYVVACKQSNVSPLGWEEVSRTDPWMPITGGFVRLAALAAAFGCGLMAVVLAIIASETRRRP